MPSGAFALGFAGMLAVAATFAAAPSADAAVINLSCDKGGRLLTIDPRQQTITDDQPQIGNVVVSNLSISPEAYFWSENDIDFIIERNSGVITGTFNVGGRIQTLPMADPHCIRTPHPVPKF